MNYHLSTHHTRFLFRRMAITAAVALTSFGLPTISMAQSQQDADAVQRVIFLGDSITQAGAGPGGYVTLVQEAVAREYSEAKMEIIGAGISGNRVPDLERRLERDVLSKAPTTVVIYIGINDVWHSKSGRGTSRDEYEAGLLRIVGKIKDVGAEVILCTPTVIGEKTDRTNELDNMLDDYCDVSRHVAEETGSRMLDLRKAFLAHLGEHNADNQERGILTSDGVHLNPEGNQFVARLMLGALFPEQDSSEQGSSEDKMLRHIVMFAFKEDATTEQIDDVVKAFAALPEKIDTIADFEYGTDVSGENLADGFTHCFVVTFKDIAGRDAYLPHAAHQEFVELVGPVMEKVLVLDYWTKN